MVDIEVFDEMYGWQNEKTFCSQEIVALQMSGIEDNKIASSNPNVPLNLSDDLLKSASDKLSKFWTVDKEDEFLRLVRESDAQYWLECSATMASEFTKIGAIPVPNTMVKYLLYNKTDVIPAQDGIRYMHQEQDLPDNAAWKTVFLLSSIKQYDAVCNTLSPLKDYNITSRKDAVSAISCLYDLTSEPMVYETFPIWRETVRKAQYYLRDSKKTEMLTQHEGDLLFKYSKYYLTDYKELNLEDIPAKYLDTVTDKDGVVYSKSGKRLISVADRKAFNCTDYTVADGVESLDGDAMMCLPTLKHITLPDSLRRIGCNQFLHSGIENLTIPASVDFLIDGCLCEGCESLKTVTFQNHQEYLDIATFSGCSSLESVQLPKGLVGLSDMCFCGTNSLKTLDLTGIRWIGSECFLNSAAQLNLPKTVEEVAPDAFTGMPEHAVYLENYPNPHNFPIKYEYSHHSFASLFTEGAVWINDLAALYGLIRYIQDSHLKEYMLDEKKKELTNYLKWLHDHIADDCEFDDEMIEFCAFTMEPSTFCSLWFASVMSARVSEEDLFFKPFWLLKYGIEFKKLLSTIYATIDSRGSYKAIEDFVESIGEDETWKNSNPVERSKFINETDPQLLDEIRLALINSYDEISTVRMKTQYGYSHTTGPTLTVSKDIILRFYDELIQQDEE